MKITIERELDMDELFYDIASNLAEYTACEEANLTSDDITPDVLSDIFSELADMAAKRAARGKRV